jgi:23S rRNA pseudouridine2604 synthase
MSELSLSSRREADEWIERGWVKVDGQVVRELGVRVHPDAVITLDPRARSEQASRITIVLHKPLGYVSGQAEDGHEPAIVLIRGDTQWSGDESGLRFDTSHLKWLAPAGRLDLDSTGLLVFTQDGRVARRLIGEDTEVEKQYEVRIEPLDDRRSFGEADLALLRQGLALDGEVLKPARVEMLEPGLLCIVLRQGKKRQIRRMCELVGQRVVELVRTRIGPITLDTLPPGQWRYVRSDESLL